MASSLSSRGRRREDQATTVDRRARFEALAMPHLDALYRTALGLVGKPEDAEEVVQETFLRAYRTFDNFRPGTREKAWLFTILYSIVSNLRRARWRKPPPQSLDETRDGDDGPRHEIADWTAMEQILDNPRLNWEASEARRAVDALPAEFATAVTLVDVEGLSYEEAAEVLTCPVGTVRSRLFRARRRLAEELRELAVTYGLQSAEEQ